MFFKKSACSQSLSPLGHSVGFASCKAWCVLISASLPKTSFPGKGAILLGLPPQTKQGCLQSATQSHYTRTHKDSQTKPLHDATAQMAVNAQMRWHKWLTTCTGATPQSKDALVACQKFCTMQNQQSKQRSTPHFYIIKRFIDSLSALPL